MFAQSSRNLALAVLIALPGLAHAAGQAVEVFKTATCPCCEKWIKHLEANGMTVKANNVPDTSVVRQKLGMPEQHGSCHTAVVKGYVIEGHVPAAEIKRLLAEKPKNAKGLAVPGMPMGSPGMEAPTGEPYDVLLVNKDGSTRVFKHYK
jgi:hypothetical protein